MKVPYALTMAMPLEQRREQALVNLARQLPRLQPQPVDDRATLHVACYGPSLRDTWRDLGRPLMSMSGATKWLAERGVVPDYHVDMDPRANKAEDVTPPIHGVKYLLASVCSPAMFDALAGENVELWHCVSGKEEDEFRWFSERDPGSLIVQTGQTIGLGALQIGGILGFRHFEIHGMDGSFANDGVRHAGPHTERKRQKDDITWDANRVTYRTSKIMANAVAETLNNMRLYPIFCVFHGEGLTQALVRKHGLPNACCADEPRAVVVRNAKANILPGSVPRKNVTSWSLWEAICWANPDPAWLDELQTAYAIADARRSLARFNTGSISLETGLLLRALCNWRKPKVVVEIGTFIGKSTVALQGDVIYTCDRDNDCLPSTDRIRTHPYQTSTEMLSKLVAEGVKVDLFFFDGRLADEDIPLVHALSRPDTVYAFDDYYQGPTGKGMANAAKLLPGLQDYGFVPPHETFGDRTTLALLVPMRAQEDAA